MNWTRHSDRELLEHIASRIEDNQEKLVSTLADLTSAVQRNSTDVQALIAAVQAIPAGTLAPADQAALDAAVAQLGTDDIAAEAAEPAPAPVPPVTPPAGE